MGKKSSNIVSDLLNMLWEGTKLLPMPLEAPYGYLKRVRNFGPGDIGHAFWDLKSQGVISLFEKNNQKFIKLTKKGELKVLLQKARNLRPTKWDGKWRLVIFDIPEGSRNKRNQLRRLLKEAGFVKLQASVFICPWALNREAVDYLKKTQLIEYIRIMRIDDLDDDRALLKKFRIKN